ncbi:MAG: hypothetical protein CME64_14210 [Halobacteriovoraceae bacterium]|nr:hypothetical protein [Halobacteriovoraceae bacterium]|tara:strand:- start:45585 stop:45812 length:228 start_codon:yes stop_codon:yes gene_type:complete
MQPDEKRLLTDSEKKAIGVENEDSAYEFILDRVIEERCDEFDYELEDEAYTIIKKDMEPIATSIFKYTVIASKKD